MRDDIDRALALLEGTIIRTRSEFLRSTVQYCLDDLADANGGSPVSLEERIRRVLGRIPEFVQLDRDLVAPRNSGDTHPESL
jgi:hypothetical protein